MAWKKARQALDRSRKVVSTKIYIYNELFTWDRKVLDKSRKLVKIAHRVVYKAKTKARQSTRQVK